MPENKTYYDDVLIKLKRTYGKDEAVAALSKKISELEIELGKSTAYIQELEYEKTLEGKELKKQIKLDEAYKMMSNENKKLRENIQKVKKLNRELAHQICLFYKIKPNEKTNHNPFIFFCHTSANKQRNQILQTGIQRYA